MKTHITLKSNYNFLQIIITDLIKWGKTDNNYLKRIQCLLLLVHTFLWAFNKKWEHLFICSLISGCKFWNSDFFPSLQDALLIHLPAINLYPITDYSENISYYNSNITYIYIYVCIMYRLLSMYKTLHNMLWRYKTW